MYDYFVEFCGVTPEMIAESPTLQKALVAGSMGLACFALVCNKGFLHLLHGNHYL